MTIPAPSWKNEDSVEKIYFLIDIQQDAYILKYIFLKEFLRDLHKIVCN